MSIKRSFILLLFMAAPLGLGLVACADDPILSPKGVEDSGAGGSYGKLEYPAVPPADSGMVARPKAPPQSQKKVSSNPKRF